jgi:hypothetical protein
MNKEEGTHYPALKFEEYVASVIIKSKSQFTIKNLIVKNNSNKEGIQLANLNIEEYLNKELVFDTQITKTTKPEELYKLLLPYKNKWSTDQLPKLLVEDEDVETYERVFGLGMVMTEKKW